jgi:regulator of chromosome condensation
MRDGKVLAWGLDNHGQLGVEAQQRDPNSSQWVFPARPVLSDFGGGKIRKISAASQHTLFLTNQGRIFSCGCAHYGRLGIAEQEGKTALLVPMEISEPRDNQSGSRIKHRFVDIAVGQLHSAAVTYAGKLFAWGCGDDLQLGSGEEKDEYVPVEVIGRQLIGIFFLFSELCLFVKTCICTQKKKIEELM